MVGPLQGDLYQVVWELRRLAQRMEHATAALHRRYGLSASMRAALDLLAIDEPQTIPRIARARGVSRQHIQVVVRDLIEEGLVQTGENPAHRRSALLWLTPKGRRRYEALRKREDAWLEQMETEFPQRDLRLTARTLWSLSRFLDSRHGRALAPVTHRAR